MQVLIDNTMDDTDWYNAGESYDPLTVLNLIDKKILSQTKYQYWYATVYDQECEIYGHQQQNLTNKQYCEKFNTKVDVGEDTGIKIQHRVLIEDM